LDHTRKDWYAKKKKEFLRLPVTRSWKPCQRQQRQRPYSFSEQSRYLLPWQPCPKGHIPSRISHGSLISSPMVFRIRGPDTTVAPEVLARVCKVVQVSNDPSRLTILGFLTDGPQKIWDNLFVGERDLVRARLVVAWVSYHLLLPSFPWRPEPILMWMSSGVRKTLEPKSKVAQVSGRLWVYVALVEATKFNISGLSRGWEL
jgi:hypothetical protein